MPRFKTVFQAAAAEFSEKKSRFIGHIRRVETEEEARAFIASVSEEHGGAAHNVFCYVLRENNTIRFSDAGEPSGTAGKPALEVLLREKVTDACLVVTRYFGGIKLGAGGLVRAYARAAKEALDKAGVAEIGRFLRLEVSVEYRDWEKAANALEKAGHPPEGAEFGERVSFLVVCPEGEAKTVLALLGDISAGRAKAADGGMVLRPIREGPESRGE